MIAKHLFACFSIAPILATSTACAEPPPDDAQNVSYFLAANASAQPNVPSAEQSEPTPPELERRSTPALISGVVLTAAGGLAITFVGATAMAGDESATGDGQSASNSEHDRIERGTLIGGLVGLAVGIPLMIYGAKRVPKGSASVTPVVLPQWAGSPAAEGWQWRF